MSQTASQSRTKINPLSADELSQLRSVGERLRAELLALLENVPVAVRGPRGLSRHLQLDRNTCHRVLTTIEQRSDDGVQIVLKVPGVTALRQFVDAMEAAEAAGQDVRSARAAVERFAQLVDDLGGSVSSLQRRAVATQAQGVAADSSDALDGDQARQVMHAASRELVGRSLDALLAIHVFRPSAGDAKLIDFVTINEWIGHEQRNASAMPLSHIYSFSDPNDGAVKTGRGYGELLRPGGEPQLLRRFCTEPHPTVTTRHSGVTRQQMVIETERLGRQSDIVVGSRVKPFTHVAGQPIPVINNVVRMRYPARQIVFDTYFHRSLARTSVQSAGVYTWHPELVDDLAKFWHEKMPNPIRLELLGPGTGNSSTPAYRRHQELTGYVFEQLGWEPNDFVGFRIAQAFPVWNTYYYLSSDFGTPAED